ncbi:hypothetical protein HG536_0C06270 [Torulaspora globosa]|uniref:TATA element modulatory factor 1 TATA binding domain-containing protein n=1 Tax=Torulaspora globosa TaxID=48254 RepID=A0A7G3ZG22_9SACH|nr:uncharacterized protein HG536_0C06270 [Torulaspora globosa]QLL32458.1 hypothetical protein HG536_0C06270 [Torulaspora globosa]
MNGTSKKLTLEERLSQAAQKGKRRTKKQDSSSGAASPTPSQLAEARDVEADDPLTSHQVVADSEQAKEREDVAHLQNTLGIETKATEGSSDDVDELSSIIQTAPWSSWLPADGRPLEPLTLLRLIDPHIKQLVKQNSQVDRPDSSASSLVKVIREKDEMINQLRQEGEKLSKTELKQNATIKSLNKTIENLREEIEILQNELVDKLEALEQLSSDKKDLSKKIQDLQDQVKELTENQLDVESLKAQLSQKENQIEELQASLNIKRKDFSEIEAKLRGEIQSLRSASREEIASLESNLEQLRIELEIAQKASEGGGHDDHLQEQYKLLRTELESNRENWTALEDALNSKISTLEARVGQTEKLKGRLADELASTAKANGALQERIKELSDRQITDQKTIEELQSENKSLSTSLEDIKDDFKLLQKQYNLQKAHLEHRIDSADELPRKLSAEGRSEEITDRVKLEDDWLLPSVISSINESEPPIELKGKLGNDSFESVPCSPNLEKGGLELDINDIPNEASELPSLPRAGISRQHSSSNNIYKLGSEVPISNQMNAQMVTKLAGEIRRFEVEVSSLKGQCDRAQKEKMTANDEIVRLLEENECLKALEKEKVDLSKEVEELRSKLETSLQLLGEKTERAEELENDVQDLKDMMKQQIQDMIDLQNKSV